MAGWAANARRASLWRLRYSARVRHEGEAMKTWCRALSLGALLISLPCMAEVVKYVRYESQGKTAYGVIDGDSVKELSAAPWADGKPTKKTAKLASVKLLAPAEPTKVVCAGLNYKSHIGQQKPAEYVGLFSKPP